MTARSDTLFRILTVLFALALGAESLWLLVPQFLMPGINRLPTDAASAAAAAEERRNADTAALIGIIRGDLWAQSAFTYADLLWTPTTVNSDSAQALDRARQTMQRALADAPHKSSIWLLLAALETMYPSGSGLDTVPILKMSYYTGSSELELMPLRLRVAVQSDFINDVEMRDFISRELKLLLARKQNSAIAAAYDPASQVGKRFIEQVIGEIDPTILKWLRAGHRQPISD